MHELRTERLWLRQWRDSDIDDWAALSAGPEVRAHFPTRLTRDESATALARYRAGIRDRGVRVLGGSSAPPTARSWA